MQKAFIRAAVLAAALSFATTLSAAEPKAVLPEVHKAFECATCHGADSPVNIPDNQACLACHGPMEQLVEATSKYALNPHQSPHWGTDVPCGTCHKQHEKPTVQCAACHGNQNYRVR